jgi:hypothetical protein
MPTLKRKNANGQWEYIQVSGLDVSQLKDEVDSVATSLADMTTQLKDEVDSVATSLADMTTQLTDIVKVNAHSFGAKGDGINNDTTALQSAFTAMKSGDTFILPYGTYKIDNRVTISASNCTFYFYGTFKMAGGIQTPYGLITISGSNNKFYNLSIDGNKDDPTVIDPLSYGTTAILVIGTSASNLYFNNTTLSNSFYTSCIFNGKSTNVVFDGGNVSNIGEHAFYVSGGNNNEITFKNITCQNIGLKGLVSDPQHEGYFIKSKNPSYGNNSNFHIYNIHFNQTITPDYGAFFLNVQDLLYCDIDTVFWSGMVQGITGNAQTGKVRISNLDNTNVSANYGNLFYANNMPASDITIRDSVIAGYQSNLNVCHKFHNCRIVISSNGCPLPDVSAWTQYWDLVFEDCTFSFSIGKMTYPIVNQNVFFRNCDYISTSATAVSDGAIIFGLTSFGSSYRVEVNGGTHNFSNYTYFIYGYNLCNLTLQNFSYARPSRGANFGTLKLINVVSGFVGTWSGTYTKLIAKDVFYNGDNFTEYKGQLTIPLNGTTSNTVNLQFLLLRTPTTADVILSPVGDTGGVRYYPTFSTSTLSVTCNSAAPSAITFNVLVKTNS